MNLYCSHLPRVLCGSCRISGSLSWIGSNEIPLILQAVSRYRICAYAPVLDVCARQFGWGGGLQKSNGGAQR